MVRVELDDDGTPLDATIMLPPAYRSPYDKPRRLPLRRFNPAKGPTYLRRGKPPARRGAVAKRYEENARQPFLLARFNSGQVTADPAARLGTCDDCRVGLVLTLRRGAIVTGLYVHVHHVVARSSDAALREVLDNLRLLCAPCHFIYDLDKGGELWRRNHQ